LSLFVPVKLKREETLNLPVSSTVEPKGFMSETKKKMTMGLIVGNRGFFPGHLAKTGREEMIGALQKAGIGVIALTPEQSGYGAVETHEEAKRCAALFAANGTKIDGIVVTLPNFGDERAIADTVRLSGLRVPILVQATPDTQ